MKINQTDNQMEIKASGALSLLMGFIFVVLGIVISAASLTGLWKTQGNGQSTAIVGPVIGIVFVVVGIVSAFLASNHDTILQKGGISTVTFKHILFGKSKVVSFETKQIQAVWLSTQFMTNNNVGNANNYGSSNQRQSQLSLVLDDNSLVQIAVSSRSSGLSVNGMNVSGLVTKAPLSKQAELIAQFLGVSLKLSNDISAMTTVAKDTTESVHENIAQNSAVTGQTASVNQQPDISSSELPIQQPITPAAPVEPTQSSEHTNWQS